MKRSLILDLLFVPLVSSIGVDCKPTTYNFEAPKGNNGCPPKR